MRDSLQRGVFSAVFCEPHTPHPAKHILLSSPDDTLKASKSLNSKSAFSAVLTLLLEFHFHTAIITTSNKTHTMRRLMMTPAVEDLPLWYFGTGLLPKKQIGIL